MARNIGLWLIPFIAHVTAIQLPLSIPDVQEHFAQPAAKKSLVSSEALQAEMYGDNLMTRAKELFEIAKLGIEEYNHPTRVIGSAGHAGTIEYIYSTLAKLGDYYTVSNQSFDAVTGNVFESRLVIGNSVPESAAPMGLTPPTSGNEPVYGDVVIVSQEGCQSTDYPAEVNGSIALIRRGTCAFGLKSELAGRAGAKAAIIYNNENGTLGGTLGDPSKFHVATWGLSQEEATTLIQQIKKGQTVDAIAYMDAVVNDIRTTNIIAQTNGGDPDNCVMLGGHSDSVAEGPGINDDGTGSLTLLEIATQLTKFDVNNCVRFAWWAGEEEGLLGSNFYASTLPKNENLKVRLFMDYDMLASPNYAYQIYNATNALNPEGSEQLRDLYIDFYESHGLNYTFIPFDGRSDYVGFIVNGIPAGGIATGAEGHKTAEEAQMFGGKAGEWYDKCYHQLCDDVGNVNVAAWELNTKLVAHSVATYALCFEGFPERTGVKAEHLLGDAYKYRGHKLVL